MPEQATPLIAEEVYLLERYCSKEYFLPVRDSWEAMVKHVERCLDVFMRHLPPDYRSRRLSEQPDIVWGERILPNFRNTLQHLYDAYIRASHGDLQALGAAKETSSDRRGQVEFWSGWMSEPHVTDEIQNAEDTYWNLLHVHGEHASNIGHTISASWIAGDLSYRYSPDDRGPLDPPARWPRYQLNNEVRARTGQPVPRSGIYLPEIGNSCAALLIEGDDDAQAMMLTHIIESHDNETGEHDETPIAERRSTIWTLVERVPGEFANDGLTDLLTSTDASKNSVPAGQQVRHSGWWFTPAQANSRRYFKHGEIFPNIEGSAYGATFWQWSPDQSSSKL